MGSLKFNKKCLRPLKLPLNICHYLSLSSPRKPSSDDRCEQPDWGGDGSPGNRGLLLSHHRHNDVDDGREKQNVNAPDDPLGGALLPHRWPAMVFLPLALTNQGQAVCYPGLTIIIIVNRIVTITIVIVVLSRSYYMIDHHHSQQDRHNHHCTMLL